MTCHSVSILAARQSRVTVLGPASKQSLHLPHIERVQGVFTVHQITKYENYDIAIAMSSSLADPVLGHCTGRVYLNN